MLDVDYFIACNFHSQLQRVFIKCIKDKSVADSLDVMKLGSHHPSTPHKKKYCLAGRITISIKLSYVFSPIKLNDYIFSICKQMNIKIR